jgi:hypothetical protein
MCHVDPQSTEALPLVLLGIRTSYKADLQASVAELVYGEPLRIPGELLTPAAGLEEPEHLITQLRRHIARLRPVPAARHASPTTFVHKDLRDCKHVLRRLDAPRRALERPYSGPYQVLSRREKTLQLLARGKPVTVSADRVKPAYVLDESGHGSPTLNSRANTTPAPAPAAPPSPPTATQTTRSGRTLQHLKICAGGGGVLWGTRTQDDSPSIIKEVFILPSPAVTALYSPDRAPTTDRPITNYTGFIVLNCGSQVCALLTRAYGYYIVLGWSCLYSMEK